MSTPSYWATIVSQFLPHGSHSFTDHTMAGTSLWTYTWTRFSPQAWEIPDSFISQQDEVLVAPVTWVRGSWLNMFPSTGHSVCNTHFPQDKQPSSSADPTACNFWWGMWKMCALPLPMSLAMSLRKWRNTKAGRLQMSKHAESVSQGRMRSYASQTANWPLDICKLCSLPWTVSRLL